MWDLILGVGPHPAAPIPEIRIESENVGMLGSIFGEKSVAPEEWSGTGFSQLFCLEGGGDSEIIHSPSSLYPSAAWSSQLGTLFGYIGFATCKGWGLQAPTLMNSKASAITSSSQVGAQWGSGRITCEGGGLQAPDTHDQQNLCHHAELPPGGGGAEGRVVFLTHYPPSLTSCTVTSYQHIEVEANIGPDLCPTGPTWGLNNPGLSPSRSDRAVGRWTRPVFELILEPPLHPSLVCKNPRYCMDCNALHLFFYLAFIILFYYHCFVTFFSLLSSITEFQVAYMRFLGGSPSTHSPTQPCYVW